MPIISHEKTQLSCSIIERAKGDKMKKMKKKKPSAVQLVEFQKPQIYELVEESDSGHGHGHGGGGHLGGGNHGGGGGHGHKHGIGGHGGHGLKMKKKHGRSIGGWFWAVARIRCLFGFGFLIALRSNK